jgi:hypothetical protein
MFLASNNYKTFEVNYLGSRQIEGLDLSKLIKDRGATHTKLPTQKNAQTFFVEDFPNRVGGTEQQRILCHASISKYQVPHLVRRPIRMVRRHACRDTSSDSRYITHRPG